MGQVKVEAGSHCSSKPTTQWHCCASALLVASSGTPAYCFSFDFDSQQSSPTPLLLLKLSVRAHCSASVIEAVRRHGRLFDVRGHGRERGIVWITSQISLCPYFAFSQQARRSKIPVLTFPHAQKNVQDLYCEAISVTMLIDE